MDDVTSHLAASVDKHYSTTTDAAAPSGPGGRPPLRVSLLHNPSHLEIVGCVAAGALPFDIDLKNRQSETDWMVPDACM